MNEELNKKMAEFAGIYWKVGGADILEGAPLPSYWVYPDGSISSETPDFTDPVWGIAYCFKWLVPEVCAGDRYSIRIYTHKYNNEITIMAHYAEDQSYYAGNPQLALALSLAFEKLIDRVSK